LEVGELDEQCLGLVVEVVVIFQFDELLGWDGE